MLARATSDKGVLSHASGYTIMTSRVPSWMVGNIGLSCPVSMCSNVAMHANMHVRSSIGASVILYLAVRVWSLFVLGRRFHLLRSAFM